MMDTKRYVLFYKDGDKNMWEDFDTISNLLGTVDRCSWIKEYKIIDSYNDFNGSVGRYISMIDDYIMEPNSIDPEWVSLLICARKLFAIQGEKKHERQK